MPVLSSNICKQLASVAYFFNSWISIHILEISVKNEMSSLGMVFKNNFPTLRGLSKYL